MDPSSNDIWNGKLTSGDKVMDIMEIIKTENGHRQVTSAVERIIDGVEH